MDSLPINSTVIRICLESRFIQFVQYPQSWLDTNEINKNPSIVWDTNIFEQLKSQFCHSKHFVPKKYDFPKQVFITSSPIKVQFISKNQNFFNIFWSEANLIFSCLIRLILVNLLLYGKRGGKLGKAKKKRKEKNVLQKYINYLFRSNHPKLNSGHLFQQLSSRSSQKQSFKDWQVSKSK